MSIPRPLVTLAVLALLASPAAAAQATKEKDKDKAKPPARSYTDEDLKKYKDKPKDTSAEGQGGSSTPSTEAESSPRRKSSRESGGLQEPPPPAPPTSPEPGEPANEPEAAPDSIEAKSPEEAEWKGRAARARGPLNQARARVAQIDAQMAELRDRLNPMSANYVLGGNSNAGPGQVYEIEEKLRNLEGERAQAQADVAEGEKGFERFLEEARAAGVSPAWLTP